MARLIRKKGSNGSGKPPRSVTFHYIKTPDFRATHVDGAIGGITTRGFLHIAMYSERPPIPTETTHIVADDGKTLTEDSTKRKGKSGVIRQIEVDLLLNEATARELRIWLDQRLEEFETIRERQERTKRAKRTKDAI